MRQRQPLSSDEDSADDEDSEVLVGLWSGLDPVSKGCVLMLALALAAALTHESREAAEGTHTA